MIFKNNYFLSKDTAEVMHVHIAIFSGPDEDHLRFAGRLILSPPDWEAFQKIKAAEGDEIIFEQKEECP